MLESSATASPSSTSAPRPGDGLLPLDLEPQPEVEAQLGLAALERPDAAADAGDEPLPRQLAEVAPNRDFRNREGFRKFRNVNGIARLEQPQDFLHPLVLRQIRHALGHSAPSPGTELLVGAGAATLRQLR